MVTIIILEKGNPAFIIRHIVKHQRHSVAQIIDLVDELESVWHVCYGTLVLEMGS